MIFNVGQGAGGGSGSNMFYLTGTLTAGQTVLTLTSPNIVADTIIQDLAVDIFGVVPTDISAQVGGVNLTFPVQENDINVKVGCI